MDIIEKLRELEKRKKKSSGLSNLSGLVTGRELPQLREKNKASLQDFVPGEICENDQGTFFLISESYPSDHRQGFEPIPESFDLDLLNRLAVGEEEIDKDSPHLVYLDTETTGLAGGAGTFAFLVGLGFWSGEGESKYFKLLQYFMRDYDEETCAFICSGRTLSRTGFRWSRDL